MASGLFALLDDVATIAKVAAATLDDVATQTVKAGSKAAGVVIDDTAVTPRYAVGFAAERELSIIWRIAKGSLRNKLVFLLPAALLLSALMPWLITPILMVGGAYLCFEGAEKLIHMLRHDPESQDEEQSAAHTPEELENEKVSGAIRTDLILSAEIMAIALATIEAPQLLTQAVVLAIVGVLITAGVYGAVALIVKADDIGAAMARGATKGGLRCIVGRALVVGMPKVLAVLSVVGTVAMLWVGGNILVHGLATFGWHRPEEIIHGLAHAVAPLIGPIEGAVDWVVRALASAVVGLGVGLVALGLLRIVRPAASH
ncbi:DUF808 domain-containing protein [Rubellimicrobium arenae]|uniref:DUF808 domain-containing protein n=1 Tax=Rubellimicrobium arenae TaxID=2817372 RepID=UPI001B30EEAE|nr:DUF808 domain-containing protein [Rubellimicrobium arenae]